MTYQTNDKGFSLIEILLVLLMIAILACLGIPSWQRYLREARRADARASLLQIALLQQQYLANHARYGNLTQLGIIPISSQGYYQLRIRKHDRPLNFIATAIPVGSQALDSCGVFAINQEDRVTDQIQYANNACWYP